MSTPREEKKMTKPWQNLRDQIRDNPESAACRAEYRRMYDAILELADLRDEAVIELGPDPPLFWVRFVERYDEALRKLADR